MTSDVVDLSQFYGSSQGQMARRLIRRRLRRLWPSMKGQRLLGLGYATPYLRLYREEAERVIAIMPAAQGVIRWPEEEPSLVALADEAELPLPNLQIDRVLLVHALEHTEQLRPMLREIWRVMTDGGRLLVVVPNRRGIWARLDRTPFGQGLPYTVGQLSRLLRENMFTPMQSAAALLMPPTESRFLLAWAPAWEELGERWLQTFAGVVMIEAAKQIYAGALARNERRRRTYIALPGTPAPA
ncbi:MAG TPA: methyltransferase domain-containing protein [Alphaproteobacteria bacterium]|nr:methyltransferase domain-containing protein [Alphaproteobacteria bacterium]